MDAKDLNSAVLKNLFRNGIEEAEADDIYIKRNIDSLKMPTFLRNDVHVCEAYFGEVNAKQIDDVDQLGKL